MIGQDAEERKGADHCDCVENASTPVYTMKSISAEVSMCANHM